MVWNGSLEDHEELEVLMLHCHALVILRALVRLTHKMLWLSMRYFCRRQVWEQKTGCSQLLVIHIIT